MARLRDTTEFLYRCILFVEREELFLLGQKQESSLSQAHVEIGGGSSILHNSLKNILFKHKRISV
ncbi:hypothetical protein CN354_23480 [Bacillus cereus]|nr:hypothetical protein CN354_23480 [Bacillus cereus]